MNKQDLIDSLTGLDFTREKADAAVSHIFGEIQESLLRGEDVRISGFGVFKRVETKARTGRNPQTGEPVAIAAGYRAKFRASSKLLEV